MWAGMSLVWAGRCHRCGHRDVTCADTEMSPVRAGRCHRCGRGDVTCASREMSPVRARSSLFSPSSLSPSSLPEQPRRRPQVARGGPRCAGRARHRPGQPSPPSVPPCPWGLSASCAPAVCLSALAPLPPAPLRAPPGPRSEPHPPGYSRPARPEEAGVQTVV